MQAAFSRGGGHPAGYRQWKGWGWPGGRVAQEAQVTTRYWLADAAGTVWAFGGAPSLQGGQTALVGGTSASGTSGAQQGPGVRQVVAPVVDVVPTSSGAGYWLLRANGSVTARGDARLFGSAAGNIVDLPSPVADLTPTPDGNGYWLVTTRGNVYTFGDARYFGPLPGQHLSSKVVRLVPTHSGAGYWLLTAAGDVYSFGDARYFGSTGDQDLHSPIVDMAPSIDGAGYWLVEGNGAVFSFGDAKYAGGTQGAGGGSGGPEPAEKIVAAPAGSGYWVVEQDGTAVPFGTAQGAPAQQGLLFSAVTRGDAAVLFAFSQLGKPYIWGGTGPKGYDCSGLAYRSWYTASGQYIPRVSNSQYHGAGAAVPWRDLRAGDLIFWGSSQARWQSVYHTAIYVGGSSIVEATANTVQLNSVFQWGGGNLMSHGVRPTV